MNSEKKICLAILVLLSWFIGYEVFEGMRGAYEVIRYSFAYGYSVVTLFILAAVFLSEEKKEE